MNKNVLLIFPKTGVDLKKANIQMPMSLMCVSAPLVKEGYEVTLLDQRVENYFFKKVKQILKTDPICVGLSTMTGSQILYSLEISNFIRNNSQIPIVWGGIHPTLMPTQTIKNKNIDIIVRGEGEITFKKLVRCLYLKESFRKIKGISWKNGKEIYHNPAREFIDLNSLPPIPYHLVDIEKYILSQVPGKKRSLDVYTSRGCPYQCIFCYNHSFNKSRYRMKNINAVIEEISWLVHKYNLDSIYINDDNFFVYPERVHSFCKKLIEKKVILEWGCQGVRVDSLKEIDFKLLEKSGCKNLYIGIESGSQKMLNLIKKKISIEQIKFIIDKFTKSNIIPHYNFMVGYPNENINELLETINLVDYIMKVDPKARFSSFHLITPYPGTEFYNIAQNYGFNPPSKLEEWAFIRWESDRISWVSPKMKKINLNLNLITYFIDSKVLDRIEDSLLLRLLTKILIYIAGIRWKYKKFQFCPEFRLINRLVDYRINKGLNRNIMEKISKFSIINN